MAVRYKTVLMTLLVNMSLIAVSKVALGESSWPMCQHDAQHTGSSPFSGPGISGNPDVTVLFEKPGAYFGVPAIGSDGTLYLCSTTGFYALNSDGTEKWFYPAYYPSCEITPALSESNNAIYVTSLDGILAINIRTGTLKWKKDFAGHCTNQNPVIGSNGTLYFIAVCILPDGTGNSCLINMEDIDTSGQVIWAHAIERNETYYDFNLPDDCPTGQGSSYTPSNPTIDKNGTIYFGYNDTLYALNPDGTEKWERIFLPDCQYFQCHPWLQQPIIGDNGLLYIMAMGERDFRSMQDQGTYPCLHIIDPENPEEDNSEKKCDQFFRSSGNLSISAAGNIYSSGFVNPDGSLRILLYGTDSQGNTLPNWHALVNASDWPGPLLIDKNEIIYGLFGNQVKAFDIQGNQKWSVNISSSFPRALSMGSDGTIYAPANGELYAIGSSANRLPNSPVLLVHGLEYPLNPKAIFDSIRGTWSFDPVQDWSRMGQVLTGIAKEQQVAEQVQGHSFWKLRKKAENGLTVYISNYTLSTNSPSISDIRYYAQNLAMEIETIKSLENTDKVDIIAHSMGGLVIRSYIESNDLKVLPDAGNYPDLNYNHDVGKLIMLGTPNHGAFLSWSGIVLFGIDCFIPLPPKDIYQCLQENKYFSFAQMLPERSNPYLKALNRGITGNWLGVKYSTIAGNYFNLEKCSIKQLERCAALIPHDGIVSVDSVQLDEVPPCRSYIRDLDHFSFPASEICAKIVTEILSARPFDIRYPCPEMLTFACPVSVTVTDELGRTIDSYGNNQIPDAEVTIRGDEKTFHLPPEFSYAVDISGYDDGSFTLFETSSFGSGAMQINVFNDVPIDVNTNAFLWIAPDSTDRLMMIDHGDFTWEEERIPDVNEIKSIYQTPVYTCKDKIEFTGYELVNQRRISRTEFEYSMRVRAANAGGQDIENISLRLDKVPTNTTILDDTVEFSLIEARKESLSDNTFTIRTDRSIEGLEKDVAWRVCTCSERSRDDLNKDWIINFVDLARLAEAWLDEAPGMPEDLYPDSVINLRDFAVFTENWLTQ